MSFQQLRSVNCIIEAYNELWIESNMYLIMFVYYKLWVVDIIVYWNINKLMMRFNDNGESKKVLYMIFMLL